MNEVLLKPATYQILRRIPNEWMHEQSVKELICQATDYKAGDVSRRLAHLIRLDLVQRRPAADGPEIRRVNWDHR